MSEIKIDLSAQCLEDDQKLFKDNEISLKNKNFIFAKNGSGKSTLAKLILKQKSSDFDVRIFNGFETQLSEDKKLNSVILGQENEEIQEQIDTVQSEIDNLNQEKESLKVSIDEAKNTLDSQTRKVEEFKTNSAREITEKLSLGRNYYKNNFASDIPNAKKLENEELEKQEKIAREQTKTDIPKISSLNTDAQKYLNSVNKLISFKLKKPDKISGIDDNKEKENFAREGMKLYHNHQTGDVCAFCGSEITDKRWDRLEKFFSDEYQKLEKRISDEIGKIDEVITNISNLKFPAKSSFYAKFEDDAEQTVQVIKNAQTGSKTFFEEIKKTLDAKNKDKSKSFQKIHPKIPESIDGIIDKLNIIIEQNNKFTQTQDSEKNEAKEKIRFHHVQLALEKTDKNWKGYTFEEAELDRLNKEYDNSDPQNLGSKQKLENKEKEILSKNNEKQNLIEQTKDERKLAQEITEKLEKSGHSNIKLVFVGDSGGNRGEYRIGSAQYDESHPDKNVRDVSKLSSGEKNIIAFLYFIGKLSEASAENKPKIIIFDDPMNSNDDTMQYLIVSEIEKLYDKKNFYEFFILMTHNSHFYLNVSFLRRMLRDGKNPYEIDQFMRLQKGVLTVLKSKKDDFSTQYGSLWRELRFLYDKNKPEMMLNPMRRIIETYLVFNGVSGNKNAESKRLLNSNSHLAEVGDLETDLNGKTKEEIRDFLKDYLKQQNNEKHFNNYWGSE